MLEYIENCGELYYSFLIFCPVFMLGATLYCDSSGLYSDSLFLFRR